MPASNILPFDAAGPELTMIELDKKVFEAQSVDDTASLVDADVAAGNSDFGLNGGV